jgi:hypothetical protein
VSERQVVVEVEQALGPGLEFELDRASGRLVARRARLAGPWLGLDRAVLVESDDGNGRGLPVLVAVPASTFAGCMIEANIGGAVVAGDRVTLLAQVPGAEPPPRAIVYALADTPDGQWLDAEAAALRADEARRAYRQRRAQGRVVSGRAWLPPEGASPELLRFSTPHSRPEYSLANLPPRFLRGLEHLLDDDERVLYWIERPELVEVGLADRLVRRPDRRAALLLLTDRQLIWVVDHADPTHFLMEWGVDADCMPVEILESVDLSAERGRLVLALGTRGGAIDVPLPPELASEAKVMHDLVARFTPARAGRLPRRVYKVERIDFEPELAGRFKQAEQAQAMLEALPEAPLAFLYSPAREGQREAVGLALGRHSAVLVGRSSQRSLDHAAVHALRVVLSPLVGRLAFIGRGERIDVVYPAPFAGEAAALMRLARRLVANS